MCWILRYLVGATRAASLDRACYRSLFYQTFCIDESYSSFRINDVLCIAWQRRILTGALLSVPVLVFLQYQQIIIRSTYTRNKVKYPFDKAPPKTLRDLITQVPIALLSAGLRVARARRRCLSCTANVFCSPLATTNQSTSNTNL
jgi:hypothetical protein